MTKVSANPAQVDWPRDEYNFLQPLRAAILNAAARVNGDPAKEKAMRATLATGAAHSTARAGKMREMRETAVDAALERQKRDAAIEAQRAKSEIARRKNELDSLVEAATKAGYVEVPTEGADNEGGE